MTALTFVIPVRHPDNAKDWSKQISNLQDTIRSISSQTSDDWVAIIIANTGSKLPELPKNFHVKWVDFPPNPYYQKGGIDPELFGDAVRLDKGRRILAGLLHFKSQLCHVMVVDDDDFVSNKLVEYVKDNPSSCGWYVRDGYIWTDGSRMLSTYHDFSNFCGSSHIIRADLLELPVDIDSSDDSYVKDMLGSHVRIEGYLAERGVPLQALPFYGAVYRVASSESHSQSKGILRLFFLNSNVYKKPWEAICNLFRLRYKSREIEKEFFGG